MVNFKPVVLFLKVISLFIVQRNFGNIIQDIISLWKRLFNSNVKISIMRCKIGNFSSYVSTLKNLFSVEI